MHELKQHVNRITSERDTIREHYDDITRQLSEMTASCERLQHQLVDQDAMHAAQQERHAERDALVADLQAKMVANGASVSSLQQTVSDGEEARATLLRKVQAQASTIRELRASLGAVSVIVLCRALSCRVDVDVDVDAVSRRCEPHAYYTAGCGICCHWTTVLNRCQTHAYAESRALYRS